MAGRSLPETSLYRVPVRFRDPDQYPDGPFAGPPFGRDLELSKLVDQRRVLHLSRLRDRAVGAAALPGLRSRSNYRLGRGGARDGRSWIDGRHRPVRDLPLSGGLLPGLSGLPRLSGYGDATGGRTDAGSQSGGSGLHGAGVRLHRGSGDGAAVVPGSSSLYGGGLRLRIRRRVGIPVHEEPAAAANSGLFHIPSTWSMPSSC